MYIFPGMSQRPAVRVGPSPVRVTINPAWVNSAEKWLKPLTTGRAEENKRAYGIAGNTAPAECIRQACVWALHLHRTTWVDAQTYTAAYEGLVREVKARRKRSVADRARTATPTPPLPESSPSTPLRPRVLLPAAPFAPRPVAPPDDAPAPRQRGWMFAPPADAPLPVPPPKRPTTPIEDAIRETQRGLAPGARGGSHYQAGRFWTSKAAANRTHVEPLKAPRIPTQPGTRQSATRGSTETTGHTDRGITMGQLAAITAEMGNRWL